MAPMKVSANRERIISEGKKQQPWNNGAPNKRRTAGSWYAPEGCFGVGGLTCPLHASQSFAAANFFTAKRPGSAARSPAIIANTATTQNASLALYHLCLFGSFAAVAGEGAGAPGPLRGCSVSDFLFSRTDSSAHRMANLNIRHSYWMGPSYFSSFFAASIILSSPTRLPPFLVLYTISSCCLALCWYRLGIRKHLAKALMASASLFSCLKDSP
jgi:hypothetical protein